jgi:hypothetical protein
LLSAILLTVPAVVSAQRPPAPESPMLLAPRSQAGLGLFLVETAFGGIGGVGIWRSPYNWGLRVGVAEDSDDPAVFGGLDFAGALARQTRDLPLDIDWLIGAFLSAGDNVMISAPLGLTAGHTFVAQGATFTPFFAPRLVLDVLFFEDAPPDEDDSDVDLDVAADLGLDLRLSGFQPVVRFAASLGRDAIGIGLVFGPSARRRAAR